MSQHGGDISNTTGAVVMLILLFVAGRTPQRVIALLARKRIHKWCAQHLPGGHQCPGRAKQHSVSKRQHNDMRCHLQGKPDGKTAGSRVDFMRVHHKPNGQSRNQRARHCQQQYFYHQRGHQTAVTKSDRPQHRQFTAP